MTHGLRNIVLSHSSSFIIIQRYSHSSPPSQLLEDQKFQTTTCYGPRVMSLAIICTQYPAKVLPVVSSSILLYIGRREILHCALSSSLLTNSLCSSVLQVWWLAVKQFLCAPSQLKGAHNRTVLFTIKTAPPPNLAHIKEQALSPKGHTHPKDTHTLSPDAPIVCCL